MKYVIVYWSRYGNGKKVVEHLAETLRGKGAETQVLRTEEANPTMMPMADMYVFSAPAEAFNLQMNMRRFMKQLTGMEGRKYGIINTHGMDKNRLAKMEKLLSKKNMVKVAELDFKMGKDVQSGNGLSEGWQAQVDEFARKL
jgi:flavodoxin